MRAILFDFGGTLDCPGHWLDRFLSHYRSAGVDLSRVALDAAYDSATRAAYRAAQAIDRFTLRELVAYLVDLQLAMLRREGPGQVRDVLDEAAASGRLGGIADHIIDGFVDESRRGLEQSRQVLLRLSRRFKIGVVSNFYGNLERVLVEAKIAESVAASTDSSQLGIFKPDPGIFEAALSELEIPAAEAVMVGDSIDKDCAPAQRLGMRTVWLRHAGSKAAEQSSMRPDYTIDRLAEVEELRW